MCVQVPMLRSEDYSEDEGYEQEERFSEERENDLASSSTHSVEAGLDAGAKSKAKVRLPLPCILNTLVVM